MKIKIGLHALLFFVVVTYVSLSINLERVFPIAQAIAQTANSARPIPILIADSASGTVSTQSWWGEIRERNRSGMSNTGGLLQMLLSLILQILNLIQQVIGGQNPSSNNLIGILVPTPSPTPNPNLVQMPTVNQQPLSSPVISSIPFNPTTAPAQMQPSYYPLAPSVAVPSTTAPSAAPSTTVPPPTGGQAVTCTPTDGGNYSGWTYDMNSPVVGDKITTTWTATQLNCGTGTSSPWPGMGDTINVENNLAQLGIDFDCSSGSGGSYAAWTEQLGTNANMLYYSNDQVKQGDQLTASITYSGNGKFDTTMTDSPQGWTINLAMQSDTTYKPMGAEVINESMSGVPNFAPITLSTNISLNGQQLPFSSGPNLKCYDITNISTGNINGTSFVSTYR